MTDLYRPTDRALYRARIDGTANDELRWHQVLKLVDLSRQELPALENKRGFAIIGFRSDEGVIRNSGRVGAAEGPKTVRQSLAGLPVHFDAEQVQLVDLGDICCFDINLEAAQEALGTLIEQARGGGYFPLILGGGHEVAYGSWLGATKLRQQKRLGVFNIDAHLDLRPLNQESGRTSGNSFTAMDADEQQAGRRLHYLCLGVQRMGNTRSLLNYAIEMGATLIEANHITSSYLPEVFRQIEDFAGKNDMLHLTICMDVFSPAFAPGVSAPTVLGLAPNPVFLSCLQHLVDTGKLVSMDVAETNPRYDIDGRTSRLAASLIFTVVSGLVG